jgi:aromatic ring hydroxylase
MSLRTGNEYIASIQALGLEANILGHRTSDLTRHPLVKPSLQAVAAGPASPQSPIGDTII